MVVTKLTTLSVFILFWCFIPFWNQETKQITLGVNSRQSGKIRLSPRGYLAVLFNLEHTAYLITVLTLSWWLVFVQNYSTTNKGRYLLLKWQKYSKKNPYFFARKKRPCLTILTTKTEKGFRSASLSCHMT
jgi:hypothetical protein